MNFIIFILIGAGAGWLASRIMDREKKGFLRYLVLGIVGGFLGGWIFGLLQISTSGNIGEFITAVLGSILAIWLADKIRS
jgi:uncharacterized membrane protein YeaQ/YmgE (transglycosylase-associated protein family)